MEENSLHIIKLKRLDVQSPLYGMKRKIVEGN